MQRHRSLRLVSEHPVWNHGHCSSLSSEGQHTMEFLNSQAAKDTFDAMCDDVNAWSMLVGCIYVLCEKLRMPEAVVACPGQNHFAFSFLPFVSFVHCLLFLNLRVSLFAYFLSSHNRCGSPAARWFAAAARR